MMESLSAVFHNVRRATCILRVFEGAEFTSRCGTGFVLKAEGEIVTAAHVVLPVECGVDRQQVMRDRDIRVLAKFPDKPERWYKASPINGPEISGVGWNDPLVLDITILVPDEGPAPFEGGLVMSSTLPDWGDEVFLTGYSDEVQFPFRVDELFSPASNGYFDLRRAMKRGYGADMGMVMFKRGMVGCIQTANADVGTERLSMDLLYIDNGISAGASGGPVFTRAGAVVGVIVERGLVEIPEDEDGNATRTASGITRAISSCTLTSVVQLYYRQIRSRPDRGQPLTMDT